MATDFSDLPGLELVLGFKPHSKVETHLVNLGIAKTIIRASQIDDVSIKAKLHQISYVINLYNDAHAMGKYGSSNPAPAVLSEITDIGSDLNIAVNEYYDKKSKAEKDAETQETTHYRYWITTISPWLLLILSITMNKCTQSDFESRLNNIEQKIDSIKPTQ